MKTATISTVRTQLTRLLDQSEPVAVTHRGQTRAILLPVDSKTAARINRKLPRKLMELLIEADERITRTGGLTHEEFWRAVEKDATKTAKATKPARRSR